MKISIYSRNDMERMLSQGEIKNTAIISFHDPVGRGRRCLFDYRYYPNQLVYHKIFDALRKYEEQINAKL